VVIERLVENHRRYRERFAGAADYLVPDNLDGEVCSISFVAPAASREHLVEFMPHATAIHRAPWLHLKAT
jgi:hypothetical protein